MPSLSRYLRPVSQENVDTVRRLLPVKDKRWDEFAPHLDPDLEIIPAASFPEQQIFRGPAGFERWRTRWPSTFDKHEITVGRTWDAGDHVVVELHERVKSAGSDFYLDGHRAHVWTFRDGLVVRLQIFDRLDDALAAAGVRE